MRPSLYIRTNALTGKIIITSIISLVTILFFTNTLLAANCCKCTTPDDIKTNICIKTVEQDCAKMPSKSVNSDVKKLNCTESLGLPDQGKCRAVSSGICVVGPVEELTYKPTAQQGEVARPASVSAQTITVTPPKLGIAIPGLTFSGKLVAKDGYLEIPFISEYIAAVYKYLVGISIVAAAIMITWGGFRYITGATTGAVQKGKKIIVDSIIGLLLILGAYTILSTINPDTLSLKPQSVEFIEPLYTVIPVKEYKEIHQLASKTITSGGFKPNQQIAAAFKKSPGAQKASKPVKDSSPDPRTSVAKKDLQQIIKEIGQTVNLDPCVIEAIIMTETGGNPALIGHDENAGRGRSKFLKSGVKYSGATFTPGTKTYNDDKKVTATPPDYGLDWRFSHGIGLGQCTIFPKGGVPNYCEGQDGSHGIKYGNKCFTVPIAMTMEGSIECMVELLKIKQREIQNIKYLREISTPCNIFCYWLGTCKRDPSCADAKFAGKKIKVYNDCKKR